MSTYIPNKRRIPVWQFVLLVIFSGLSPVLSLEDAVCGGIHCYDLTAYCCTDETGLQSCCYESIYEEAWFWCLLVIGLVLITVLLFCTCRALYRHHNASQYTKLRLQQPGCYSRNPGTIITVHMPPPVSDISNQLPSYGAIMDRPPPVYSVTEHDEQR